MLLYTSLILVPIILTPVELLSKKLVDCKINPNEVEIRISKTMRWHYHYLSSLLFIITA